MATLAANVLTLADYAKRLDPNGKISNLTNLLSQTNEILMDMSFIEGNLATGHRTTSVTSLPTVASRLINNGTTPSKSTTAQIEESCSIFDAWSECDQALAELGGNVNEVRFQEAQTFIEAMNQKIATTLIYGNSNTTPSDFNGFATRYNSLSGNISQNVISASGSGSDNTSIYLVVWSPGTCTGIYPKGSTLGLKHEDFGLQTIETTSGIAGSRLRVYQDKFEWKIGLVVRDWRYVVRIPNIDVSNLVSKTSAADLIELMIKAINRIPNLRAGNAAFYMNRTVKQMLEIQRRDDVISGGGLTYQNVDGVVMPYFREIPVRICDAIINSEAVVS